MKRPPANQAAMTFEVAAPVAVEPTKKAPRVIDGRAFVPKDHGPIPRKIGDVFTCWVCQRERVADKNTHVWWIQLGNDKTSGFLRLISCSKKCDTKHAYCVNCNVYGHDRNDVHNADSRSICPRYHAGPRNRALKLYQCFAHQVIERHKSDVAQGWSATSVYDTLAKLMMEHGGDFEKVREVIDSVYVRTSDSDEFGNKLIRAFEQAVRNDPDYGVEYHVDTPKQVVERARVSFERYKKDQARPGRQRVNQGHMAEAEALATLGDETMKSAVRLRAIDAYGARASTVDAAAALVPLLAHNDSSIRSTAAWALFSHRTDEVRAAMLARAQVEDVPLLKAYLEQLGEQP